MNLKDFDLNKIRPKLKVLQALDQATIDRETKEFEILYSQQCKRHLDCIDKDKDNKLTVY